MALIHIEHLPETVKVNLALNVIVPEPGEMKGIPVRDRKVLYLLHGLSDDTSAWQRFTSIEIYARRFGLVVVMPTVNRSFYLDQPNGQQYFTYLVDELPRYMQEVFGIEPVREKTLIAGLSMGGYGAMKAALLRPERFFAAASFSGVLAIGALKSHPDPAQRKEFEALFGDLTQLSGGEHDPLAWLERISLSQAHLPKLYVSCGLQDEIYPLSVIFRESARKSNVPLEYHEADGKHDWYFWDKEIQRFLEYALDRDPVKE